MNAQQFIHYLHYSKTKLMALTREEKKARRIERYRKQLATPWYWYVSVTATTFAAVAMGFNLLWDMNDPGFSAKPWLVKHSIQWMITGILYAIALRSWIKWQLKTRG